MPYEGHAQALKCDVVVVGGGNAGLVAAIEARNRGANVVLIEKGPQATRGGNSRFTYGDFRVITDGTAAIRSLLCDEGVPSQPFEIETLTADFFYGEAMRLSEGLGDKMLTRMFVDHSYDAVVWMKDQGIRWTLNPTLAFDKDGVLFYPSGNANLQVIGAGHGLVETLYAIAEAKGVICRYEAPATRLIVAEGGNVAGVIARTPDGLLRIDAHAVILCCGGFQACAAKRRAYLGEHMDLVKVRGTPYNTGDWIDMTQEVGAKLVGHWGGCHASPISRDFVLVEGSEVASPRYAFPYSIMVNRNGERFVDEGENFFCWTYNRFGKDILRQPGSIAFQIFDDKVASLVTYKGDRFESDTLEGLAMQAGIEPRAFIATVNQFNAAIPPNAPPFVAYELDGRRTHGLPIDKLNWSQRFDKPPYRAYAVMCGLTMTYGGVKTNERAQVIDTNERAVNGLYAVGELTGGYFYHTYLGGSGLIRGAVMGRVAAQDAVSTMQ